MKLVRVPTPEPAPPDPAIAALIDRWHAAKLKVAAAQEELAAIEVDVLKLGRGKYVGTVPGAEVTVVAATPEGVTYELVADNEEEARKICGELFAKLFDRVVSYKPCSSFRDVVGKLLKKGAAGKLLELCAKATKGKKEHLRR